MTERNKLAAIPMLRYLHLPFRMAFLEVLDFSVGVHSIDFSGADRRKPVGEVDAVVLEGESGGLLSCLAGVEGATGGSMRSERTSNSDVLSEAMKQVAAHRCRAF